MFARSSWTSWLLAVAATVAVVPFTVPASAATFEVRRAISMDLWVEWPDASRWNDADVVANFPEWRAHVTPADFARLRAAGFDTIRLPIEPAFLLHSTDPVRQAEVFAGLNSAIAMIVSEGLNVVVDMHTIVRGSDTGFAGTFQLMDDDALFDRYAVMLSLVADDLRAWPADLVALEVINEPTLDCRDPAEQARWQSKLEELHASARTANPEITLVLTGACSGSPDGLAAMDPVPIADDNTIWTFHTYDPFIVTHHGALWAGDIVAHLRDIRWPPTQMDLEETLDANEARIRQAISGSDRRKAIGWLRDNLGYLGRLADPDDAISPGFETAAAWADRHGISCDRIFVGEFGMIGREWDTDLDVPEEDRLALMRTVIALAEENGFGWAAWSFGGAFGLVHGFGGEPLDAPLYDRLITR